VPVSNWEIYNATLIGAGARAGSGSGNNAFTFRAYTQVRVYNGIFTDFNGLPITGGAFSTGAQPTLLDNLWFGFSVPTFTPEAVFAAGTGNQTNVNPMLRGISRDIPFALDPRPDAGSPADTSPRSAPDDGFYQSAAHYGAFTSGLNWAVDWTALGNSLLMNPAGGYTPVVYPDDATPTITMDAGDDGVQILYTGTLQSSSTLGGTYNDVPGATSPYRVPGDADRVFYRASN